MKTPYGDAAGPAAADRFPSFPVPAASTRVAAWRLGLL